MPLLLFDIDGTLLRVNGAGRRAVESALSEFVGQPLSTDSVRFSGKTDPQIVREVLSANGVEADADLIDDAVEVYAETAATALQPTDVATLPGASDLVDRLSQIPSVQLGLVTGNVRRMAYTKLQAVNLASYFPFGAFGCDHADRNELPSIALQRAARHTGRSYAGDQTVIIGDTVHDIQCGRGVGARSVGVCTGSYSRADLASHNPDLLLDDLQGVDGLLLRLFDYRRQA